MRCWKGRARAPTVEFFYKEKLEWDKELKSLREGKELLFAENEQEGSRNGSLAWDMKQKCSEIAFGDASPNHPLTF